MAFVVGSCTVIDFEAWHGRLAAGIFDGAGAVLAHTVYRGTGRPEVVVIVVELTGDGEAAAFAERLTGSGLLGDGVATVAGIAGHVRVRPPEGPYPHVH